MGLADRVPEKLLCDLPPKGSFQDYSNHYYCIKYQIHGTISNRRILSEFVLFLIRRKRCAWYKFFLFFFFLLWNCTVKISLSLQDLKSSRCQKYLQAVPKENNRNSLWKCLASRRIRFKYTCNTRLISRVLTTHLYIILRISPRVLFDRILDETANNDTEEQS